MRPTLKNRGSKGAERPQEWKMIEQRDGAAIISDNKIVNRGKSLQTFSDLRPRLHCQRFGNGYILQKILWQAVPLL